MTLRSDLDEIARMFPRLRRLCLEIASTARSLESDAATAWRSSQAVDFAAPRSPALTPGRGIGHVAKPTEAAVMAAVGRETESALAASDALDEARDLVHRAWGSWRHEERRALALLRQADRALLNALSSVHRALAPDKDEAPPSSVESAAPGCMSCARVIDPATKRFRFTSAAPADKGRGGLCRFCDDWRRTELAKWTRAQQELPESDRRALPPRPESLWPPEAVVVAAVIDKRRITTKVLREIDDAERRRIERQAKVKQKQRYSRPAR